MSCKKDMVERETELMLNKITIAELYHTGLGELSISQVVEIIEKQVIGKFAKIIVDELATQSQDLEAKHGRG